MDARQVAQQDLGGLVVELLALGRVGDVAGLQVRSASTSGLQYLLSFWAPLQDAEGEDVAVRVGPAAPEGEVGLEVALAPGLEHRDVLLRLDRHRDARLREHGLDHERRLLPVALRAAR